MALRGALVLAAGTDNVDNVDSKTGPSSRPPLAAEANCQAGRGPNSRAAAAAAEPSDCRASANTDPVTGSAAAQASSSWSSTVNSTRRLSARPPNRRSQPRTLLTGRSSAAAMLRWPAPAALASSAWPITATVSARRSSVEAGSST